MCRNRQHRLIKLDLDLVLVAEARLSPVSDRSSMLQATVATQPALAVTAAAIIGGPAAFTNANGIGLSLCFSPTPPWEASGTPRPCGSSGPPPPVGLQPPPMLAVVLDAGVKPQRLAAAVSGLRAALSQLPQHTRLLLLCVDTAISVLDLKHARAQAWVLHGGPRTGAGAAAALPALVRAADVRATPLAHAAPFLDSTLAAVRCHPRQRRAVVHVRMLASALDIALFLLSASMAAWDAQHRPRSGSIDGDDTVPPHNARVMLLTDDLDGCCPAAAVTRAAGADAATTAAAAIAALQQCEPKEARALSGMLTALGIKAAQLDVPVDIVSGSLSAPGALLLQGVCSASHGRLLHQPGLAPPLAGNLAAMVGARFGWDGVIDVRAPPGVRVAYLTGPLAVDSEALPTAAHVSGRGSNSLPIWLVGPPDSSGDSGGAAGAEGPVAWSSAAAHLPVISAGMRCVAALQLTKDWAPGSSIQLQVIAEWTAADGRRVRQVCAVSVCQSPAARALSAACGVCVSPAARAQRTLAHLTQLCH